MGSSQSQIQESSEFSFNAIKSNSFFPVRQIFDPCDPFSDSRNICICIKEWILNCHCKSVEPYKGVCDIVCAICDKWDHKNDFVSFTDLLEVIWDLLQSKFLERNQDKAFLNLMLAMSTIIFRKTWLKTNLSKQQIEKSPHRKKLERCEKLKQLILSYHFCYSRYERCRDVPILHINTTTQVKQDLCVSCGKVARGRCPLCKKFLCGNRALSYFHEPDCQEFHYCLVD